MQLSFKRNINGTPTYFIEKILHCFHYDLHVGMELNHYLCFEKYGYGIQNELVDKIRSVSSKKHTIREDKKNRWKPGNKIHFIINPRTKNMFQFAPIINVVAVQRICIIKVANVSTHYTYKCKNNQTYQIEIDGNCVSRAGMIFIAINDGFENLDDFFDWFSGGFSGKLIHWTELLYKP